MKKMMIEAFELKKKGYYKQAIEVYYKLLSQTDDFVEILAELADLYYLIQNYQKSKQYITKILEKEPAHTIALEILEKIYLAEFDYNSAIDTAKQILSLKTDSESKLALFNLLMDTKNYEELLLYETDETEKECIFLKAKALYNLKRYEEALEILDKDAQNEPELLILGKIYNKLGLSQKTKEVFKKLKEVDLKDAESLNFLGLNYMDEYDLDKAIECFKEAIRLKEDVAKYYCNLGQAYFLKGWMEESQKSFNTAICLNPNEEAYHYSLAYSLYRSGEYDKALMHLDESNLNSKILTLIIKAEQGDLAKPKIELEKLLEDNSDNRMLLFSLAKIYYKLDMIKQAKSVMQKALKLEEKSFEYNEFYIKLLLKLEEFEEAKKRIQALIEKYPKYYYAKVLEGEYFLLTQDYQSLYETAQELISLEINHFEGYYYNAVALFETDDTNFAIESLKKAITLDVNNASLYVKMSEFYQALGRYEDALAYIKEASEIDKSAKNRELYIQLSAIVRKNNKI